MRPDNTRYDGRFEIPTLDEVLAMVREESKRTHRQIGVHTETKHPNAKGDSIAEAKAFFEVGVDAVFTDHADSVVEARDEWLADK